VIASSELDRARGALLGTFVGDALGMPFEGASPGELPEKIEMVEARLGRGTYTDDTQMMIALAESLLARGRVDEEHLASAFRDAYEPERGYGGGTRQVLELWGDGVPVGDAAARIFGGEGSRGIGAAMRIAPIAVRFASDPSRLHAEAERSAQITHTHPVGIDGALIQAAAIGAALRNADILAAARSAVRTEEMSHRLREIDELLATALDPHEAGSRLGTSPDARHSVPTALYSALAHETFEQAVTFAVRLGGDTDTVAAMTGAIAGARCGTPSIPAAWLDALEDGDRGRRHVERLASRLVR
jgi:poly(ADP-ribose) glycohydrolase ARH3